MNIASDNVRTGLLSRVNARLPEGDLSEAVTIDGSTQTLRLITTRLVHILSPFGQSELQAIPPAADISGPKGIPPIGDVDAVTAGGPR